ncbi:MAG: 2-polyprenyl-3-methyl-6-methoxy-1,4-benzoquinone monooxygenase [Anaerolineae bacterium]|nr:MAG: 2-polyprenyl-3-methyl-6-methoxy-1,4-benzoquinone monooxygenase [Anaerolineae bacterium]
MKHRTFSPVDRFLIDVDRALCTVFGNPHASRSNPADTVDEAELSDAEKKHISGLIRVNHTGEVCAQALYLGQAMTARDPRTSERMNQASEEENDHLAWCEGRLNELDSHTSYLNPLWFGGSFTIGAVAGLIGDKWSLGFVAETERQVVRHLEGHLQRLPDQDEKSRRIVEQMKLDEAKHATMATDAGGVELPASIKNLMSLMSRMMTISAYKI